MPQHQGGPRITGAHLISCKDVKKALCPVYPSLSGDAKEQRLKLLYEWRIHVTLHVYEERCKTPAVAVMNARTRQGQVTPAAANESAATLVLKSSKKMLELHVQKDTVSERELRLIGSFVSNISSDDELSFSDHDDF
ncbi:hypothetical protein PHYSODRAFT_313611 [Phytophthora sojae]|uniref:Uncharacterized protein n=1 Tax=Phytophthora sojae (strain P6497) TaxID=1094619 RepID=G4Z252_PHYSP|nr:hypothetical protein PHYSODRAFT_313611 [Phytophthora sojae]EGZ21387.1 hypothetical protein PHYSODRAFT_313611 [Phytophthora sojae]|eukprot:XP_009524104.1 hypothetical protein PHYSODRAFT_313611 [Phytophthora sojae]